MVEPCWCIDDQAWTQRKALSGRQDRDGRRCAQGRRRFSQGSAGRNSSFRDAVVLTGSSGLSKSSYSVLLQRHQAVSKPAFCLPYGVEVSRLDLWHVRVRDAPQHRFSPNHGVCRGISPARRPPLPCPILRTTPSTHFDTHPLSLSPAPCTPPS